MLRKLYRWGPSRCILQNSYVLLGPPVPNMSQMSSPEDGTLQVIVPANGSTIVHIKSLPVWLHNPAARKRFFQSFARLTSHLIGEARRRGASVIPCGVRINNYRWDQAAASALFEIESFDLEEQLMYTNLLRYWSSCLIAAGGRGGIDKIGSMSGNSRLRMESNSRFSPRAWVSTEPRFLALAEAEMKSSEGIPSLDSLEVVPRSTNFLTGVQSWLIDAQALPATIRAFAILHQALYLRARAIAGRQESLPFVSQQVLERNRSRAISDGLQARFEPGSALASETLLDLIESLREEFQILEAEPEELAPIILGVHLRTLGFGAMQTENELLQKTVRTYNKNQESLQDGLSDLIMKAGLRDLLLERNQQSYGTMSSELMAWWGSWLKSSTPGTRHKGSAGDLATSQRPMGAARKPDGRMPENRRRQGPAKGSGEPSTPSQPGKVGDHLKALLEKKELGPAPSLQERVTLLRSFRLNAKSMQIGLAVSQLPPERQSVVKAWLAPNSGRARAFTPDSQLWNHPNAAQAVANCRNEGMSVMAVEVRQEQEVPLRDWLAELKRQIPPDIELFNWLRPRFQGKIRQELILLRREEAAK